MLTLKNSILDQLAYLEDTKDLIKQALIDTLAEYNVPVIYDADISHVSPSIPIINGSIAKIDYKDNKGKITFNLK